MGPGNTSHLSVAAAARDDPDEDFCRRAYYAGCWKQPPFNSGCCASTCDASAGMETCAYYPEKTQHGAAALHLNITFKYDPDDGKCNQACDAVSHSIWTDFCDGDIGGDKSLAKNDHVKNCHAAMKSISDQIHDVPDWCPSALTQQIV